MNSSSTQQETENNQILTVNDPNKESPTKRNSWRISENKAGKLYSINIDKKKSPEKIEKEIKAMMSIYHPTVAKLIGYQIKDLKNEDNLLLFIEQAKNGTLYDILNKIQVNNKPQNYDNTTRQMILIGVARGMKYLHDRHFIHFNLTDENVILDENYHPLIANFAQFTDVRSAGIKNHSNEYLKFKSPESIEGKENTNKTNVYSFGVLMYKVITEVTPYKELEQLSADQFCNKILNENYRPKFTTPVKSSHQNLIQKCWLKDQKERPSFKEIFDFLAYNEEYYLDNIDIEKVKKYVTEITQVTDFYEDLIQQIEKLENENRALNVKYDDNCNYKKQIFNLNQKIDQLTKELNIYKTQKNSSNEDDPDFNVKIEKLQSEVYQYKTKILQLSNQNFQISKQNSIYKADIEKYIAQINDMTSKISHVDQLTTENNTLNLIASKYKKIVPEEEKIITVRQIILKEIKLLRKKMNRFNKPPEFIPGKRKYIIDEFNTLDLKSQQIILSKTMESSEYCKDNIFFIVINNFMLHLLKSKELENTKCLEFNRTNEKTLSDYRIRIHHNVTEFLYSKNALESDQLINKLIKLNAFTFELKYPSPSFNDIYEILSFMQTIFPENQMKIAIFVTELQKTDQVLELRCNIDYIKLDISNVIAKKIKKSKSHKDDDDNDEEDEESPTIVEVIAPVHSTVSDDSSFCRSSEMMKVAIPSSQKVIEYIQQANNFHIGQIISINYFAQFFKPVPKPKVDRRLTRSPSKRTTRIKYIVDGVEQKQVEYSKDVDSPSRRNSMTATSKEITPQQSQDVPSNAEVVTREVTLPTNQDQEIKPDSQEKQEPKNKNENVNSKAKAEQHHKESKDKKESKDTPQKPKQKTNDSKELNEHQNESKPQTNEMKEQKQDSKKKQPESKESKSKFSLFKSKSKSPVEQKVPPPPKTDQSLEKTHQQEPKSQQHNQKQQQQPEQKTQKNINKAPPQEQKEQKQQPQPEQKAQQKNQKDQQQEQQHNSNVQLNSQKVPQPDQKGQQPFPKAQQTNAKVQISNQNGQQSDPKAQKQESVTIQPIPQITQDSNTSKEATEPETKSWFSFFKLRRKSTPAATKVPPPKPSESPKNAKPNPKSQLQEQKSQTNPPKAQNHQDQNPKVQKPDPKTQEQNPKVQQPEQKQERKVQQQNPNEKQPEQKIQQPNLKTPQPEQKQEQKVQQENQNDKQPEQKVQQQNPKTPQLEPKVQQQNPDDKQPEQKLEQKEQQNNQNEKQQQKDQQQPELNFNKPEIKIEHLEPLEQVTPRNRFFSFTSSASQFESPEAQSDSKILLQESKISHSDSRISPEASSLSLSETSPSGSRSRSSSLRFFPPF